jgi:hypothetical protein
MAEDIADKVFEGRKFIILSNRIPGKDGILDDHGGYSREFFAISLARRIERFLEEEERRLTAGVRDVGEVRAKLKGGA